MILMTGGVARARRSPHHNSGLDLADLKQRAEASAAYRVEPVDRPRRRRHGLAFWFAVAVIWWTAPRAILAVINALVGGAP